MSRFHQLWKNHPTIKGDGPVLDSTVYKDQCAVNLHVSLERSGINLTSFRGVRSWGRDEPRYALRAQELADWLASSFAKMPSVEAYSAGEAFERLDGFKGIVFFQNYWGPGQQGDHIDLWNGTRLTDWRSWARIHLHISWEGVWSDYRKAAAIWFWRLS